MLAQPTDLLFCFVQCERQKDKEKQKKRKESDLPSIMQMNMYVNNGVFFMSIKISMVDQKVFISLCCISYSLA